MDAPKPDEGIEITQPVCEAIHGQKHGASATRNLGLFESQGEFIQYLDSDDALDPHRLLAASDHGAQRLARRCSRRPDGAGVERSSRDA